MPPEIAYVLAILHILLVYGRHLALTLECRAVALGFSTIAQFFGTARLPVIRARLSRGLLRIQALQRVLLDRARRGRDLVVLQPRKRPEKAPVAPQTPDHQAGPQTPDHQAAPPTPERQAEAQPSRPAPIRRRNRDEAPDPANLPTLAQLQAEIRRWGIGQAIADICRDLGVSFCLCDWRFAVPLGNVITWYGADQGRLVLDFHRREAALDPELDGTPPLRLPEQTREATRRMLGFLIGDRWPVRPAWVPAPPRVPTPPALCAPAATRPP